MKLPANVLPLRPVINLGVSLSCKSTPTQMATLANLYYNTLRECQALWITTLRGVELGTFLGRGSRRESAHHLSPRGGWGSKTPSSTPVQLQCASVVELRRSNWRRRILTGKGRLWNLAGDVRMGVMRVSLNCQVRSFCNVSSIPAHLDDSPFFPLLLFDFLISFSPHTCSLCVVNVFSSFFCSISSSPPLLEYHG